MRVIKFLRILMTSPAILTQTGEIFFAQPHTLIDLNYVYTLRLKLYHFTLAVLKEGSYDCGACIIDAWDCAEIFPYIVFHSSSSSSSSKPLFKHDKS